MELYARHLAWLHATPRDDKKSRKEQLESSTARAHLLELPEVGVAGYLLTLWWEAGTVSKNAGGIDGLTWTEIESWVRTVELDLSLWEKLTIKSISDAYANEYSLGSDKDRPAPYCSLPLDFDRNEMGKQVVNVMSSIMSRQPQKPSKANRK